MNSTTKLQKTKIALLIVEGPSDATTFENALRNYVNAFSDDTVRFDVIHGDRTLKDENKRLIPPERIRQEIGKCVNKFLRDNSLHSSDLLAIGQICDLDACFASDECYVNDFSVQQLEYDIKQQKIISQDRDDLLDERHKKCINIKKLCTTPSFTIKGRIVPYKIFYFGINLEHCLYDKPNCTDEEKQNFSEAFDEEYAKKSDQFEQRMRDLPFVSKDYSKSWNEDELKKLALNPLTNICILFDWIKEIENKKQTIRNK